MGRISTTDARGLYTKMLVAVYSERKAPTSFFQSFFTRVTTDTLEVSIEVQRGSMRIAVDVERQTRGNRNTFSRSTEKIFIPPYFKEFFEITEMDLYDRLFLDSEVDSKVIAKFIRTAAQKLRMLQDKIERAIEKQCADVLLTGIVQLRSGDNINYGRKADSLVDSGSGQYWANSIDPYAQIQTDCEFIRNEGMIETDVFNMILGANAITDLYNNTAFKARQNLYNLKLDAVAPPQAKSVGGTLHGEISVGPYRVRLWTYQGIYKDEAGNVVKYMESDKYILLPDTTEYTLAFGAVPQLINMDGAPKRVGIVQGEFIPYEYIDEEQTTHTYGLKSAPLAIPVAIDTTVTRKVVADA